MGLLGEPPQVSARYGSCASLFLSMLEAVGEKHSDCSLVYDSQHVPVSLNASVSFLAQEATSAHPDPGQDQTQNA